MSNELIVGKASLQQIEEIHRKIATTLSSALDTLENKKVLTKEDLAILQTAQRFVKDNDVVVDLSTKSGKTLNASLASKLVKAITT